jgi:hypothetical protein
VGVGFGPSAGRLVSRLPANLDVVASDLEGAVSGLEAAVGYRRAGRPFLVAPLVDDPRALIAQKVSGRWIERLKTLDGRYRVFDALAAERWGEAGIESEECEAAPFDEPHRRVLRDFAMMSDALLVRSARDVERIARVLGRRRPSYVAAPGVDPDVPSIVNAGRRSVVVWAPLLDAGRLGVIAMALDCMKVSPVYVCASGALEGVRGDFVRIDQAPSALESASCVVDASTDDPASAIALARLGIPVVAAATSGAGEFLDGVLEYDPWDWRTIFAALSAARGAGTTSLKRDPVPGTELTGQVARTTPPRVTDEPLVTIIVLTYNRRTLLPFVLDSLARQTYGNLDVLVVNNGGEDVADIIGRYPFARLMTLPENILPNSAIAVGLQGVRGKYFGFTSDDDEFFPDHVARLVFALETSNGEVAHSNTMTRYIKVQDGVRETVAYRLRADRTADPLHMLVGSTMSINSILFRHDVPELIGGLATELAPADLEYTVRASQRFDFVHADAVTCEFNYIIDGSSYTHRNNMYDGLKAIYERYPSNGSTIVERRREAELQRFDARSDGQPLWPPDLLLPKG